MNLAELFATWQAWNARDVSERAARRADAGERDDDVDLHGEAGQNPATPTAIEALAAQHELAELLGGWRWHTVTAAREQGATWHDVAAATGTDPTTAQQGYCDRVAQAESVAAALDIPFHDAERYRAAAADDTDLPAPEDSRAATSEDIHTMTTHDDQRVEHISGPDSVEDGLVVGEIALPGGLPPEDDDEDDIPHWTDAFEIADRDGYVLFDPTTPGGFRALTTDERTELTDSIRASTPPEVTGSSDDEIAAGRHDRVGPRVDAAGVPWVESEEGIAERERWAVENADPATAHDNSHPDDIDRLQQRLDDLRVRLTGYTWREDRDEALADRREQLGRWYTDDHPEEQSETAGDPEDSDEDPGRLPHCLIYPDDPRWFE